MNTAENNIIDISFGNSSRKRIRVDNDDNRVLLLNTTDNNIIYRLTESYHALTELEKTAFSLMAELHDVPELDEDNIDTETLDKIHTITAKLKQCDDEMKEKIDYVFDSKISNICCDGGSMYDIVDGRVRYDLILDVLGKLYADTFKKEISRLESQKSKMKKHTAKYNK